MKGKRYSKDLNIKILRKKESGVKGDQRQIIFEY
jgi:hypothetical protein